MFFWAGAVFYGLFYEVAYLAAGGFLFVAWGLTLWIHLKTTDEVLRFLDVRAFLEKRVVAGLVEDDRHHFQVGALRDRGDHGRRHQGRHSFQ